MTPERCTCGPSSTSVPCPLHGLYRPQTTTAGTTTPPPPAPLETRIDQLQRLGNIVANLAHPRDDHRENPLEDEAHDIICELRAALSVDCTSGVDRARLQALEERWRTGAAFVDARVDALTATQNDRLAELMSMQCDLLKTCADELAALLAAPAAPDQETAR